MTEGFSITSCLDTGLTLCQLDVMDVVQPYRAAFSILSHTTGQTGQLSPLQVVILSSTGELSEKSAPSFFSSLIM